MDELVDLVSLNMTTGIGAVVFRKLRDHFGSARAILDAPERELRNVAGISSALAGKIGANRDAGIAELELAERLGIKAISQNDPLYPTNLSSIYDTPLVLYVKGELLKSDALALSIVGSRRCTHYGIKQAGRFATALARMGFTIVSGLAQGIDTAAHQGALKVNGRTIAVLGNGLASIYPPRNAKLAEEIAESGAVISEFPLQTRVDPRHFPQRNRVVSGLSLGTMVVEAARRSGTLTTVHHALEQGREVFALPGQVDSPTSFGTHDLIRQGARLVTCPDEVVEELGPLAEAVKPLGREPVEDPRELTLNSREREVYKAIDNSPKHIDEIIRATGLPAHTVSSTLTILEIKRAVKQLAGSQYVRG